jgi:hypothetical protein
VCPVPLRPSFPVRRGRASDTGDPEAGPAARPAPATRLRRLPRVRVPVRVPDRAFTAITTGPALLTLAWLVPGTAMLLAGRLLPLPMVLVFAPLAFTLCYSTAGQLPARWPRFGAPRAGGPGRR